MVVLMEKATVVGGRFEIISLAGEGGMSVVYRALDRLTGDVVGLKVLRDLDSLDHERFLREALVLADLSHPCIVRYVAHGMVEAKPFLVMEWLDGEDLDQRLSRHGITVMEAIAVARRACEALVAAHALGVIHRDIKPPNLFLPNGDVQRLRVLDFGIARRNRGTHAATRTGTVLGTPGYMAPEQMRGDREMDARADIFSVGCVLFECLTGRAPFEADTPIAILAKILMEDAPRVSSLRPGIAPELDDLVASMLARLPQHRPSSAQQVIHALDALGTLSDNGTPAAVQRTDALTHGEQRMVSVIAVGSHPSAVAADDVSATSQRTMASAPPEVAIAILTEIADSCGGRFEVLGGAPLVVFSGEGVARDLATRAVRCALLMARETTEPVGVVTGRAEMHQHWPVGEAIARAFQLVDQAVEGFTQERGVVVDDVTATLVGSLFDMGQEGSRWRIRETGEMQSIDRTEIERSGERLILGRVVSCLGREREIAALDAALAGAIADESPGAVIVSGVAGIGKTRLLTEFLHRARARYGEEDLAVWSASGDAMSAGAPFGLLAQMVRTLARVTSGIQLEVAREQFRRRFGALLGTVRDAKEVTALVAWLGELAGVSFEEGEVPELAPAREDPQWMQDAMLNAWRALVDAESRKRPLVIVLDNAQWGDSASLRFIEQSLRSESERAWIVVCLARDDFEESFPKLWESVGAQRLTLGGIARKAAERFCRSVLGDGAQDSVVARIVERAGGSPLYLEELLRAGAHNNDELPDSVLAMVQMRVEAMEPEARRVLRAASVFGQVFWRDGVAALLGSSMATPGGTSTIAAMVDEWLGELTLREVLERHTRSRFVGQTEWTFRHDLLRVAAYSMLTERDRVLGHGLAGEWLQNAGEENALRLAEHFAKGKRPRDAAVAYLQACRHGYDGSDYEGVVRNAELVSRYCNEARAEYADTALDEIEGNARLVEAESRLWMGEPVRTIPVGDEAMRLLPVGSAEWFRAAGIAGTSRGRATRFDELSEWLERIADVAPRDEAAVGPWAIAHARVAVHLYYAMQFEIPDRVLAAVERGLEGRTRDALVEARIAGAYASRAAVRSDIEGIELFTLRALAAYERAGDTRNAVTQLSVLGMSALRLGRNQDAIQRFQESISQGNKYHLILPVGMSLRGLGVAKFRMGDITQGIADVRASMTLLAQTEHKRLYDISRCELAGMLFDVGEIAEAETVARAVIESTYVALVCRRFALAIVARIEALQGNGASAVRHAQEALGLRDADRGLLDAEPIARLASMEAWMAQGDTPAALEAATAAMQSLQQTTQLLSQDPVRVRDFCRIPVHEALRALARRLGVLDPWHEIC
jgi:eukaryotic-like serine/threonine-protein kinase